MLIFFAILAIVGALAGVALGYCLGSRSNRGHSGGHYLVRED